MIKQSATSSSTWRDCGNSTLSTLTPDFSQFKMYFHLKREQLSDSLVLLAHVKHFIWFVFGGLILVTWQQRDGGSWCTYTSFYPLLVKVSQVLESTFSNNPLRAAVIPVACAPFPLPVIFPLLWQHSEGSGFCGLPSSWKAWMVVMWTAQSTVNWNILMTQIILFQFNLIVLA